MGDDARFVFCGTAGCGHGLAVHDDAGCHGVHVRGIPNTSDGWDEPCGCRIFTRRNDVEVVEPSVEVVRSTGVEPAEAMLWRHFATVAATLSSTDFVPLPYRDKKAAIMACLAYGHELGLGPMQSLQSIDVIQGKPTLKPEMMRSLIRAAGHSLVRVEANAEQVTFHGKRRDTGDEETVTFSMDDARGLGLHTKDNWKKQPRAMLTARCTAEIARSLFSDVIMGASYTPEELGDEPVRVDNDAESAAGTQPEEASRSMQGRPLPLLRHPFEDETVSGSSSRPREPEAVEGGSGGTTRDASEHEPEESLPVADPARPPSPPQKDAAEEARIDLVAEAVTLVRGQTPPALINQPFRDYMRTSGISSNPERWTVAQARAVIDWHNSGVWVDAEVPA